MTLVLFRSIYSSFLIYFITTNRTKKNYYQNMMSSTSSFLFYLQTINRTKKNYSLIIISNKLIDIITLTDFLTISIERKRTQRERDKINFSRTRQKKFYPNKFLNYFEEFSEFQLEYSKFGQVISRL